MILFVILSKFSVEKKVATQWSLFQLDPGIIIWAGQFYRKIRPYSRIKEFSGLVPYPVSLPDVAAVLPVSKSETFGVFGGNSAALVLASLPSMIIWGGKKEKIIYYFVFNS
jgi:hypothetical protein